MTESDRDLIIVAMVAYDEARGEGQEGIRAQVHSVVNRHNVGRWYSRKTLAGTCFLAYAYSALNTSDPNREVGAEVLIGDPIMSLCIAEVAAAINGTTDDPTDGATHYYAEGSSLPKWADPANGAVFTQKIGKHLFFKNVA